MTKKEMDEARKASKAKYGPWTNWTGEMLKKTVLRRACKLEFIGEPEMERIMSNDDKEFERNAQNTVEAQAVNYTDVQPLEADQGQTLLDAQTVQDSELTDAPEQNGETDA